MFEVIVFTQEELIAAIKNDIRRIGLCDNAFVLPVAPGIEYTALGHVVAEIKCTQKKAALLEIKFENFEPQFGSADCLCAEEIYMTSICSEANGSAYINKNSEKFADVWVNGYGINLI